MTTAIHFLFILVPAVAANSYNLRYTNSGDQVYYFDIDGLLLVLYECLLTLIVTLRGDQQNLGPLKEMLRDVLHDPFKLNSSADEDYHKQIDGLI